MKFLLAILLTCSAISAESFTVVNCNKPGSPYEQFYVDYRYSVFHGFYFGVQNITVVEKDKTTKVFWDGRLIYVFYGHIDCGVRSETIN